MGVLSAVYAAALHLLGDLQGNPALAQFHKGHNNGHQDAGDHDDDEGQPAGGGGITGSFSEATDNTVEQVGDDTGEDQQADAVADSLLGDPLTNPHSQGGTAGHAHTDQDVVDPASLDEAQAADKSDSLQGSQADGYVPGNPVDLLTAVLFLAQAFQSRNSDGQQLHNNAGVDVGGNTHGHQRHFLESITGHHVDQSQQIRVRHFR